MKLLRASRGGLTLLELVVVLVVLAILAAIAIPTFSRVIGTSKYSTLTTTAVALDKEALALGAFHGAPADMYVSAAAKDLPSSSSVSVTDAGPAVPSGQMWTVSRGGISVCLTTSGTVNEPGTVTDGPCGGGVGASIIGGSSVEPTSSQYDQAVLTDNPVAFWELNDSPGSPMLDSSGNVNTGTYITGSDGPLSFGKSGPFTGAAATGFPGGYGDNASQPTYGNYVPTSRLSGSYTLELWLNMAANYAVGSNGLPLYGASDGGKAFGTRSPEDGSFDLEVTPSGLHADIGNGSSFITTSADYSASPALSPGIWYMVDYAVSLSGWSAYLNGALVASGSFPAGSGTPLLWGPNHNVFVGWSGAPGDPVFAGTLADVAVYNTALTSTQVKAHYSAGT
jgi:prepilin-type N-terminal cleavage/methylation domain-containing protein